jgi:hypothetical protein
MLPRKNQKFTDADELNKIKRKILEFQKKDLANDDDYTLETISERNKTNINRTNRILQEFQNINNLLSICIASLDTFILDKNMGTNRQIVLSFVRDYTQIQNRAREIRRQFDALKKAYIDVPISDREELIDTLRESKVFIDEFEEAHNRFQDSFEEAFRRWRLNELQSLISRELQKLEDIYLEMMRDLRNTYEDLTEFIQTVPFLTRQRRAPPPFGQTSGEETEGGNRIYSASLAREYVPKYL